jgi:hypothetical protein
MGEKNVIVTSPNQNQNRAKNSVQILYLTPRNDNTLYIDPILQT